MKRLFLLLIFGLLNIQNLVASKYVCFDSSMKSDQFKILLENERQNKLFKIFRKLYEENSFEKTRSRSYQTIPKIFHYIWLGSELPEEFFPFLKTWIEKHPDWTFIFWVDDQKNYNLGKFIEDYDFEEIKNILKDNHEGSHFVFDVKNLSFDNRNIFDQATNYGERSDILRYEVIYRFGGVYIDSDMECLKPFDFLNDRYDFYTGIQPLDTKLVQLGIGLIGSIPWHPVLNYARKMIFEGRDYKEIVLKTGPLLFTQSFLSQIGKSKYKDVVLPASYFYPCDYEQAGLPAEQWQKPESFSVHHWAGSWLKESGFVSGKN